MKPVDTHNFDLGAELALQELGVMKLIDVQSTSLIRELYPC